MSDLTIENVRQSHLLCEGDQVNIGGRTWPCCREILTSQHLELAFLTKKYQIPIANILKLRSEGAGADRVLEIVHTDQNAPQTLKVYPHYPGRWYEQFEALGIATEDEAEFRSAPQWSLRSSNWATNAEGCFWMAVFGAGALAGFVSWVADFWD